MTTEPFFDKRIPDKWRDYKPCGTPIRGERIIAFKTPLSHRYDNESDHDNGIKPHERFTPADLLNHFRQNNIKLGMVVDFTNTYRYYDGKELQAGSGIGYCKIKCVGKEIPNESVVSRFKFEVCKFLAENPASGDVIGVHCTHGLNRAGYVVCRYLIECRGYTPEKAIEAFNQARGHDMERENYLEDLKKKTPKTEDLSSIQHGKRRREQPVPLDKPRYLHTSREYFTSDQEIRNWRPSHQNEYQDLKPQYRSQDRYLPVDSHFQSRNYVSRRFQNREQRGSNYRNSASNYHHSGNDYYNHDNYYNSDYFRRYDDLDYSRDNYRNHENSYHNYNNYASYGYDDFQPGRSREESYRPDRVMRSSKFSSASNRPKPYSYQTGRR